MNTEWTDAQSWIDILDHGLIGLILIAVAGIPSWFAARNKKQIAAVYDSINNRPTSIRDDLDSIRDEMRGGFNSIRADINEERLARRHADDAIRDEIARHHD